MKHAHPVFEKVFKTYDKLNNVVQENLHGIRVVKSYVREDHEIEKFEKISTSIYNDFTFAEKLIAFNMPLMQFCMYACMILISWFGAKLIVTTGNDPVNGMSTGQLMSLVSYAMQILMALKHISCTIEDGSFVLLCGTSGCGKTTMTRLFNGLIPHYHEGTYTGSASLRIWSSRPRSTATS